MARITIDITPAVHQRAGIGRLTREIVRTLLTRPTVNQYRLFSMGKPIAVAGEASVSIESVFADRPGNVSIKVGRLDDRWMYRIWYRAHIPIPVELFAGRTELYHATDFVLPPVMPGVRTVLTVHDLSFERDPASAPPRLLPFLKRVVPYSTHRATHIVADSHATANDLTNLYGIAPDRITTIYSGVDRRFKPGSDVSWQSQQDAALRKRYNLGEKRFILTVGTMQRRKNHVTLVRAFARIAAHTDFDLIISGGKGWLYDDVIAEINKLGIAARVRLAGFVADADLPALYRAASVFAFPSLYEGFGLPPLEAMACGVPVVTSNASSLPEVVGDAGLMVDPLDVDGLAAMLMRSLDDQVWREYAIAAGLERAREFTWQRAAQQLADVYERALAA